MRETDVAIVGAGLAGATAAAMLGRAGIDAVIVDPHTIYPPDMRCEKFDEEQVALLRRTGIADLILPAMGRAADLWVVRFGRLIDKKPTVQHGMIYDDIVNTVRRAIPPSVPFINAKVTDLKTSAERQTLTLATGEEISTRLVVLAIGLNPSVRHLLGLEKREISHAHSITAGFDIKPVGRAAFDFPALTYYGEHPADKGAYLTLFPVPGAMRANYLCYRGLDDPWILKLRKDPHAALTEIMPRLEKIIGAFEVTGQMRIRPADLYTTDNVAQAGVVLIGDAFSTSCPAAGTGSGKALTDVVTLSTHIPAWLATDGMGAEKIAAFYADPEKVAYDAYAIRRAYDLRSQSIDTSPKWMARRWAVFGIRAAGGLMRRISQRLHIGAGSHGPAPRAEHV